MTSPQPDEGATLIATLGGRPDPAAEDLLVRAWNARNSLQSRHTRRGENLRQLHYRIHPLSWRVLQRALPLGELSAHEPGEPGVRYDALMGIRVILDAALQPNTLYLTTGW